MDHNGRLQLVGRVTYYLGWIALACSGLVHLNIATKLFTAMQMTQRDLFGAGIALFLISVASELRVRDVASKEMAGTLRKAA